MVLGNSVFLNISSDGSNLNFTARSGRILTPFFDEFINLQFTASVETTSVFQSNFMNWQKKETGK